VTRGGRQMETRNAEGLDKRTGADRDTKAQAAKHGQAVVSGAQQVLPYPYWDRSRITALPYPGETLAEQVISGSVSLALGKAEEQGAGQDEKLWPWRYTPVGVELLRRHLRKPLAALVPAFLRECSNQGVQKALLNRKLSALVKALAKLEPVQTRMLALGFIHTDDPADRVLGRGSNVSITLRPWRDHFDPLDVIEVCLDRLVQHGDIEVGREDRPPFATVNLAATHLKHIYPFPPIGDKRVTPQGIPKSGLLDEDGRLEGHARAAQHRVILRKVFESFREFEADTDATEIAQDVAELRVLLEDLRKNPCVPAASSALASCRSLQDKVAAARQKSAKTEPPARPPDSVEKKTRQKFHLFDVWTERTEPSMKAATVIACIMSFGHRRRNAYRMVEFARDPANRRMLLRQKLIDRGNHAFTKWLIF